MFHQMLLATQTSVLNEWLTGRENYDYPIQGQMTISGRIFLAFVLCFVVYTNKGKFVERVLFDTDL